MPISGDGILEATFDLDYATVRLVVDGAMWPAVSRTNAIRNPSGETNTTDWLGIAGTSGVAALTNPTDALAQAGTKVVRQTWSTATTAVSGGLTVDTSTAAIPSPPVVRVVGITLASSITQRVAVTVQPLTDADVAVGAALAIGTVVLAPSVKQTVSATVTIPATATRARISAVAVVGTSGVVWPIGSWIQGDAAFVVETGGYFDGGVLPSDAAAGGVVAWTGTAHASRSTYIRSVASVTITRQVAGEADLIVRGVNRRAVVSGTFVGSDPEAPLETTITYRVDGYSAAGVLVASASVSVDTTGAANGLWLKVAGMPDLTVRCDVESVGATSSPTIGGVYQIIGGGTISQSVAQFSGVESDSLSVGVRVTPDVELPRVRAVLAASRVLLIQGVGVSDVDDGWYFVANVARANPGQFEGYPYRSVVLSLQRVGMPAGDGQGIPGVTWAAVKDTYATWTALMTAKATWFAVLKGL